jgi:hypothetical protein
MSDRRDNIKAGETVLFTYGQYDDYGVIDLVLALADFSAHEEAVAFLGPRENNYNVFAGNDSGKAFVDHLKAKGLIKSIDYKEIAIGSYGRLDETLLCSHENLKWSIFDHFYYGQQCIDCQETFPETFRLATEDEYVQVMGAGSTPEPIEKLREWYANLMESYRKMQAAK